MSGVLKILNAVHHQSIARINYVSAFPNISNFLRYLNARNLEKSHVSYNFKLIWKIED